MIVILKRNLSVCWNGIIEFYYDIVTRDEKIKESAEYSPRIHYSLHHEIHAEN